MSKKVLLYSGGMDSWLIDKLWKPDIKLFINLHSKYSDVELARLSKSDSNFEVVDFPLGRWERNDAIIPLRNLYLVMVACNFTNSDSVDICLGATHGDRSLDQSLNFASSASDLLSYLYSPQHWIPEGKTVNVVMPYKEYTKTELLSEYLSNGGDIDYAFESSFSCYNPVDNEPCWNCKPCQRKFISFLLNGYSFSETIKNRMLPQIESLVDQINNGDYNRGKENKEILQTVDILRGESYVRS